MMKRLISLFLLSVICNVAFAESLQDAIQDIEANVVFMRHALAPGFGDPKHFSVDDCSTQRNLDEVGIAQAQMIGEYLQDAQIHFDEILSSQWCRCKDTAEQLNLGEWEVFAGLNSFFQFADKPATMELLTEKLESIDEDELILMVTHQVVIAEVTGIVAPSGGLVIYNTRSKEHRPISLSFDSY